MYRAPPSGAMGAAGSRPLALAPSVESRAVDSVTVRTHISAPREQVYALIADVAARPAWCDHFQKDFRLVTPRSEGVGAGADKSPFGIGTIRRQRGA